MRINEARGIVRAFSINVAAMLAEKVEMALRVLLEATAPADEEELAREAALYSDKVCEEAAHDDADILSLIGAARSLDHQALRRQLYGQTTWFALAVGYVLGARREGRNA